MTVYKKFKHLLVILLALFFLSCNGSSGNDQKQATRAESVGLNDNASSEKILAKGKGSLSFKLDGKLYETDPQHTKCWTTTGVPLAMMMANGKDILVGWQMGYTADQTDYKLISDRNGSTNFTIAGKTYWTRSVTGENYLNIKITSVKDKYTLKMLSGTFEGVLEDENGNKVKITEGIFTTEDI